MQEESYCSRGVGMTLGSRTIHKAAFALAPASVNIISVIRVATDRLDYCSVRLNFITPDALFVVDGCFLVFVGG